MTKAKNGRTKKGTKDLSPTKKPTSSKRNADDNDNNDNDITNNNTTEPDRKRQKRAPSMSGAANQFMSAWFSNISQNNFAHTASFAYWGFWLLFDMMCKMSQSGLGPTSQPNHLPADPQFYETFKKNRGRPKTGGSVPDFDALIGKVTDVKITPPSQNTFEAETSSEDEVNEEHKDVDESSILNSVPVNHLTNSGKASSPQSIPPKPDFQVTANQNALNGSNAATNPIHGTTPVMGYPYPMSQPTISMDPNTARYVVQSMFPGALPNQINQMLQCLQIPSQNTAALPPIYHQTQQQDKNKGTGKKSTAKRTDP